MLSKNVPLILFLMAKTGETYGTVRSWMEEIDTALDRDKGCLYGEDYPCRLEGTPHLKCDYTGMMTPDTKVLR